jgi:hypothetical protein
MDRLNAYQTLAMLYKRKKHLINSHILNLTFSLAISDDSGKDQAIISNVKAFEYLLCDLQIWYEAPADIQRSLHERLNDLLNEKVNARIFVRLGMLKRLFHMIKEPTVITLNESNFKAVLSTVRIFIKDNLANEDFIKLGQFLVSLLPDSSLNEKPIVLERCQDNRDAEIRYTINLRNKLFDVIDEIVSTSQCTDKSVHFQEELQRLLGLDWFLLFLQPHVHSTTVIRSAKILFTLLLNMQNLNRFKESLQFGGWHNNVQVCLVKKRTLCRSYNNPI